MGEWLKLNGSAIYGTRAVAPFGEANVRYTKAKDNSKIYAIVLMEEGEQVTKAMLPGCLVAKDAIVKDVATGKRVKFSQQGNATLVNMPKKEGNAHYAVAFEISKVEKMAGKTFGKSQAAIDAENRNL